MSEIERLAKYIANRDVPAILSVMFDSDPVRPRRGFFKEDELWDYKEEIAAPAKGNESFWASIAADVLAFHNTKGGVLLFGVRNSDFRFVGATHRFDTKLFNDKIRRYVGDRFWVSFSREYIQSDQRYLGVAIIPPKTHVAVRAMASGPTGQGKQALKTGDLCIRVGDETKTLRGSEALKFAANNHLAEISSLYAVNEPNFRVLRPDYRDFTYRKQLCETLQASLSSNRTFVTSLTGIGGVGKTALATWATFYAYERKQFDFIVSLTAKDRALTSTGIVPLVPTLSSLSDLIREICDVTGFSEIAEIGELDAQIKAVSENVLSQFKGLLFVDNLETVDDPQIISFLERLPLPSRAIVTSRKTRVRVAALPVEVGPFEPVEAVRFLTHVAQVRGRNSLADLSAAEKLRVVTSCDSIPLVIEWFVGRSRSSSKAMQEAETMASEGKHGEELLEFSFRRIYDELSEKQQNILKVLSLIGAQLPVEAIAAGADTPVHLTADSLEELRDYSLIETQYDVNYRDISYSLLPVTNTFIYREVRRVPGYEASVRQRLNNWYQAKEILDPAQRVVVQQVRRGERNPELALAEVAKNAMAGGDFDTAENYFQLALERNQTSWQIHRDFAEFYRHHRKEVAKSINHYRQASENAPKLGPDRAKVLREYGMVLRSSGLPNAYRLAAEQLEAALKETPADPICRHALGDCYVKSGGYQRAVEVLEPLLDSGNPRTREMTYPLLSESYEQLGEMLKAAQMKALIS